MQVTKDPLKTKGARLTMQLAIPGRYMVYVPDRRGRGLLAPPRGQGARAPASARRRGLDLRGGGAIIRTAARGAKREDFERELHYLHKLHEVLEQRAKETRRRRWSSRRPTSRSASCATSSPTSSTRRSSTTRSSTSASKSFFTRTAPELVDRVVRYEGKTPLFEEYGVEEEIDEASSRAASTCRAAAT